MSYHISGTTRLGGLLGHPVSHSISPMMHNDSFAALGIDYVYLCFDLQAEDLGNVVPALRAMNVYGFNLTMPLKTAILPYLDSLSPASRLCGAVNTVVHQDGMLIGHNTDGIGFFKALSLAGCDPKGKTITVLGAGGAAGAILSQAVISGAAKIFIACRKGPSFEKHAAFAHRLADYGTTSTVMVDLHDPKTMNDALAESSVVINATPVGMFPDTAACPLSDFSALGPQHIVCDIIYHPARTTLLIEAERRGCRTLQGGGMLLYQGEEAFRLWTGAQMPVEMIRQRYF